MLFNRYKSAGIYLDFVFDRSLGVSSGGNACHEKPCGQDVIIMVAHCGQTIDEMYKKATSKGRGEGKVDALLEIQTMMDYKSAKSVGKPSLPRPHQIGRYRQGDSGDDDDDDDDDDPFLMNTIKVL